MVSSLLLSFVTTMSPLLSPSTRPDTAREKTEHGQNEILWSRAWPVAKITPRIYGTRERAHKQSKVGKKSGKKRTQRPGAMRRDQPSAIINRLGFFFPLVQIRLV